MLRRLTRTCFFLIWLTPAVAMGQPADAVTYYRNAYLKVANNYRDLVRPHLSVPEQSIVDDITFKFNPSQNLFAHAVRINDRQRVVEVSFGLLAFMENLAFAFGVT